MAESRPYSREPGFGGYAIGHLALHHDDRALDAGMEIENAQDDIRGDVVRNIPDDVDGVRLGWSQIMQRPGPASQHGREFDGHEV